jgi:hypothetical protein
MPTATHADGPLHETAFSWLIWVGEVLGLGTMDQTDPLALAAGLELSTPTTKPLRRSIAAPPTRMTRRMLSMASPFPSAFSSLAGFATAA